MTFLIAIYGPAGRLHSVGLVREVPEKGCFVENENGAKSYDFKGRHT